LGLGVALLGSEDEVLRGGGEVAGVVVGDCLLVVGIGGGVGRVAASARDDAGASGVEGEGGAGGDVLEAGAGFVVHASRPAAAGR
jgi:hypothetical protein